MDSVARFHRLAVLILLLAVSLPVSLSGKNRDSGASPVDRDYVVALSAADRFLHAWQTDDEEAGILMLTDRLKKHSSEDSVHQFFSVDSARASYEIGRGRKLTAGRYEFPVVLFQSSSQNGPRWMHPQASALILVKSGKSDWAIDKLP